MPEPEAETKGSETNKDAPATSEGADGENEKQGPPPGVVPFFFSAAGQQLFECVTDKDLTPDNPNKLISKEKILEDFKNRAAVSDFHPVKKKIQEYAGDQLLLVYDYDFMYGDNFYICVTEEAKELILNPPESAKEGDKEGPEEEEDEIPRTPEPHEWECLGSDLEIKEGELVEKRALVKCSFARKRRHFESPCSFTSSLPSANPESCIDIMSQEDPNFELHRMEMEIGVQAVPQIVESHCQTEWLKPCNKATQYAPRQLSDSDAESIFSSASMLDFLDRVCPRVEACLQQNLIVNLFVDDFKELSDIDGITGKKSDTNLKEYQSFADLRFSKNKVITWIEWHPTIRGIIAVSCGDNLSFDDRVDISSIMLKKQSLVLIWSFTDPIHPILFLEAPDNVNCFKFNPSDPNLIVGGCINGQVVMWNIEEYQDRLQINKNPEPVESRALAASIAIFDTDPKLDHAPMVQYCVTSSIKDGHSREVCDIQWFPHTMEICHKTGGVLDNPLHQCNQIITCSIDGTVLVWDLRPPATKSHSQINPNKSKIDQTNPYGYLDLTWKPFIRIPLPRSDNPGNYLALRLSIKEKHTEIPRELEDDPDMPRERSQIGQGSLIEDANTMFFIGTEDGEVVYCDWKPSRDPDSGKLTATPPSYFFSTHSGPVCCVERSPFFRNIFLTVGGCTWTIWREGSRSGYLLSSSCSSIPLTGGAWSPTRPGVFFIMKKNGNIDVWDLMDRSHEPLLTQNISSFPLTSIFPWQLTSKQLMLAVGDSAGTLHILEIPWNLSHPSNNEVSIMECFFQHELEKLEFSAQRMEKREVEKKALDAAKLDQKDDTRKAMDENWDEKAKKDYDNYLSLELKLLMQMGIIQSGTTTED